MTKTAAIYARVSSDRQKENGTIASQTAAVRECARARAYIVPPEWVFEDDGFSGARLDRPGLEAVQSAAEERERFLRIAETLESFRDRLRASAETLELIERQKVLRSLVKEVLVGDGEITIRHSIPMTEGSGCSHAKPDSNSSTQSPEPQGLPFALGES